MSHTLRILSLALLISWGTAAQAEQVSLALGQEGVVYRSVAGTVDELFPTEDSTGHLIVDDTAVLALDVVSPDGVTERLLVPGTDDLVGDVEQPASLIYDENSETLFLVWEFRRNGIHPLLNLISFDGSTWGESVTISSSAFALKGAPQLQITRDDFEMPHSDGTVSVVQRAILHVVWWEDQAEGLGTMYAPLVLIDGKYIHQDFEVFRLDSTEIPESSEGATEIAESLVRTPTIAFGREHRSILIGLGNPVTGEFVTREITVLPAELSRLADLARAHIIDSSFGPGGWQQFADLARAHIIDSNARMNPENVRLLADRVHDAIMESRQGALGGDPQVLADLARAHIIDSSIALFGPEDIRLYSGTEHSVEELTSDLDVPGGETVTVSHHLIFQTVTRRPAPEVEGQVSRIFLSASGQDATVAWEEEGFLAYRESQGQDWTPVRRLPIGAGLTQDEGYKVLEQRTRNR